MWFVFIKYKDVVEEHGLLHAWEFVIFIYILFSIEVIFNCKRIGLLIVEPIR